MFIVSKFSDNPESLEGVFKTSICSGNGIFEKQKSWLGESTRKVSNYEFFNYPALEENFKFVFEENSDVTFPKIPTIAILYVMKWYHDITKETGKEAQINFYRTKGKTSIKIKDKEIALKDIPTVKFWSEEVFSYVPKQKNSLAETSVDSSDEYYEELNKQVGCYVETHSHNSMSAFRSGTDEAYSYNDGIQLVFGKFNTKKIELFSWATIQGKQKGGLTIEELEHFIVFPECTFSDKDKKVLFNTELIKNIEDEVFETWNSQIVVIKPTTLYERYYQGDYRDRLYYGNYYYEETKRVCSNPKHATPLSLNIDDLKENIDVVTDVFAEDIESIVQRYTKKKSKKAEELTDELLGLIETVALYLTK